MEETSRSRFAKWIAEGAPTLLMRRIAGDIFWKPGDVYEPKGLLRLLDAICDFVLAVGLFTYLAQSFLGRGEFSWEVLVDSERLAHLLTYSVLPALVVLMFGGIYFLSRTSAKVELGIGERLFPADRFPADWSGSSKPAVVIGSVVLFLLAYTAVAYFADDLRIAASAMCVVTCVDLNTRRNIRTKLEADFRNPDYQPLPGDPRRELILQSREEALRFVRRPHLRKELTRLTGYAAAAYLAVIAIQDSDGWLLVQAYLALFLTTTWNELVTTRWRRDRDNNLRALDSVHDAAASTVKA